MEYVLSSVCVHVSICVFGAKLLPVCVRMHATLPLLRVAHSGGALATKYQVASEKLCATAITLHSQN